MREFASIEKVLSERSDIQLAYLFGSVAENRERPSSDLDIAVLFATKADPFMLDRLTADLEAAAGRSIDLVNLAGASALLAHEIISRGKMLHCRDDDVRIRFETHVTARYLDTAHLRKVQHMYLKERAEAYRATSS